MKRKTNWRGKLDPWVLEYLEGYRKASKARSQITDDTQWFAKLQEIAKDHPQIERLGKVEILPKFLDLVLANPEMLRLIPNASPGAKEMPAPIARLVSVAQKITLALEEPQMRIAGGFLVGLVVMIVGSVYEETSKRYYGEGGPRTAEEFQKTIGTALEKFGKGLRTGQAPTLKGKVNVELVSLIRTIRDHEKERMTYRELSQALEYAGLHVGDEETLRLFEWRARKKGWLTSINKTGKKQPTRK